MPRSAAQSDFSVSRPEAVVLPPSAEPVTLPDPAVHEASATATRWVMRIMVVMLLALAVLCTVGLHIPSGG
ncbi:MAG TPA: hypothetical protein VH165_16525 [Kofleriaceae bacterium]|jgi:hypothetical protein|nr:hypothetical protein [Kofleriaceae bacterium]